MITGIYVKIRKIASGGNKIMNMESVFWITTIGGLLSVVAWIWYYASLGKRISKEEKEAGRDLTFEINPFTGSAKDSSNKDSE